MNARLGNMPRVGVLALCALGFGCTGKTEQPAEVKNLQVLASLYGRFSAKNRGQPPADEAALRKFVPTLAPEEQAALGVDPANLDRVFVSPRDGQPYVVRYNVRAGVPGPDGSTPVIAYERAGRDGKRMVAYSNAKVEEVDEGRLRQLVPDAR